MKKELGWGEFLKLAGVGTAAVVMALFLGGDAGIWDDQFKSEYYSRFRRSVQRAVEADTGNAVPPLDKTTAEKVMEIGDKMHELAERGLYRWESQRAYEGTSAIHTRIIMLEMVAELAEKEGNTKLARQAKGALQNKAEIEQRVYVVFSSMTGWMPIDGGPFTAFDIAMERAGIAMLQTINGLKRGKPVSVEIVCVGKQLALAGQTTKKMVDDMEYDPYGVQARLDAEVIKTEVLRHGDKAKILLLGQSWGGAEVSEALKMYEERYGYNKNIKGLADDPSPLWAGNELFSGAAVTAAEAFGERYDDYLAKVWFPGVYRESLIRKNLFIPDSADQKEWKKRGNERLLKALVEGPRVGGLGGVLPKSSRLYIRQACMDITLSNEVERQMMETVHAPGVEENAALFFRSGGHDFDRFKITAIKRLGVVARALGGDY